MLSTLNESRAVWLQRVSDAAAALSAMRASECPDASPKPSQVEIKRFGRAEMPASDLRKYKLSAVLVGMVAAVHYILRLPIVELHILAKTDIRSLEDLRGRKVNFGPAGSGSSLTGTIVFQRLGLQVDQVLIDQQSALQKLRSGEVAAFVRVVGKPVDFFTRIPPNSGLHLVPIPYTKTFADYYTVGEFEAKDYPSLIAEGEKIETIAVPTVLSVFNWPRSSDRYRRIERFAERLFANWDQFLAAPRHPKWRDVNLSATVPGWTRHTIAEQMLARFYGPSASTQEDISRDFQAFLNRIGSAAAQSKADREALFQQFMEWRAQQGGRSR